MIGTPMNPMTREFPAPSILKTLEMFKDRNGGTIVEIGGCRMPLTHPLDQLDRNCCLDGHSTAYWTKEHHTVSIDIDSQVIANTIQIVHNLRQAENLVVMCLDGIEYLRNRSTQIDLLFLDAWDVNLPNSAEEHLKAFQAAENILHDQSLVLIDDTDVDCIDGQLVFSEGISGKGKLVIPYAIEKGWHIVFSGRQTLLSK